MAVGTVYHQGWKLDDVSWHLFNAAAVDATMLAAVKAAALVEYNAPDYVAYLKRVFPNPAPEAHDWIRALGRRGKPAR